MLPTEDGSGAFRLGSLQAFHEPSPPKHQMVVTHKHKGRKRDWKALESCQYPLPYRGARTRPRKKKKKIAVICPTTMLQTFFLPETTFDYNKILN